MRLLILATLATVICLPSAKTLAQALDKPNPAASAWLPGCRASLEHAETPASEAAGQCAGAVDALLYIGELLPEDFRSCVPLRTPRREIISAIVADIEDLQPASDRQDFKGMVLAILHYRWPCRQ